MKNEIKNFIDNCDVVSFDIYDTVLLRPYIKPSDLFLHIDKIYNVEFSKHRLCAEKKFAKKLKKENITRKKEIDFDDIYSVMPEHLKNFKEKEIELEKTVITVNPEIRELIKYAKKQGKKIVLTSDMYLPKSIIGEILKENDVYYDKLYISNMISKRKEDGDMFRHIKEELNVEYEKIFHLGDNKYSDVKIPGELGIKTFHYPEIIKNFLGENKNFEQFYKKNPRVSISYLLATVAQALYFYESKNKLTYWNKIGFMLGGPLCYAFLSELKKENPKNLLFAARDGYTLKKVYDNCFKQNEETKYVYVPRFVKNVFDGKENPQKPLTKNKAEEIKNNFKEYLKSLNVKSETTVVDTISSSFSAQNLIKSLTDKKDIKGYYVAALLKNGTDMDFKSFFGIKKRLSYANFVEFLFSAPEKPVLWVKDLKPRYEKNIDKFERIKIKIYPEISKGEVEYCNYVNSLEKCHNLPYDKEDINKLFNFFSKYPTEKDIKQFREIKNGIDTLNSDYVSVFPAWYRESVKIFNIPVITIKENKEEKKFKFAGITLKKVKKAKPGKKNGKREKNSNIRPL